MAFGEKRYSPVQDTRIISEHRHLAGFLKRRRFAGKMPALPV
jgi:hypothetical protein